MNIDIPQPILEIYNKLQTSGFEAYLVGGSVRNMLLNVPVKDWDMTTNATPEEILQLFPEGFYDNSFGTVGVPMDKIQDSGIKISHRGTTFKEGSQEGVTGEEGLPPGRTETELREHLREGNDGQDPDDSSQTLHPTIVEITTFRTEREYKDSRHPTEVAWGKTIEEDLERRDFTINAMALKINSSQDFPQGDYPFHGVAGIKISHRGTTFKEGSQEGVTGEEGLPPGRTETELREHLREGNDVQDPEYTLVDPFNGQEDLKNKIIKAVGNAQERFKEDALRLMRAIRFATQLSFTIAPETWQAMQQDASLLPLISGERIRDELIKILASDFPYEGIMLLKNAGLLQYILPELLEGIGISQSRPGRHHVYDVFEHNVLSLKLCPSTDPLVRFATLIHDVGKPKVESKDENGLVIFYNHEVAGARIAYEICNRLRLSKKDRQKVVTLIRWHMFTVDEHITDAAVRRFIRRIGVENVRDMIDLRIGDRLGSGIPDERAESWRLKKFKDRIEEQLAPLPFSINDLVIDGNDIIKELDIKPGRIIGILLQKLFEEVDEDLTLNTREYLLKRVHELHKEDS